MSIRNKIRSRIDEEISFRSKEALNTSINYIVSGVAFFGGASRYRSGVKLIRTGRSAMKSGMPKTFLGKYNVPKFNTKKITQGAIAINKGLARKTQGKIASTFGYVYYRLTK